MILEFVEDLLGEAPNEFIGGFYYVLGACLIIFFMKVILITFRSIFNINRKGNYL